VEPILKKAKPPGVSSIKFDKLTLGTYPFMVTGIRTIQWRASGEQVKNSEFSMEVEFKWGGNPQVRVTKSNIRVVQMSESGVLVEEL
jgi:Ca2+-dependent lipid-binding protein